MDWNGKISSFFSEYVNVHDDGYILNGNLTFTAIRQAAKLLLDEKVFKSIQDMRTQAMKDYAIILPETVFN